MLLQTLLLYYFHKKKKYRQKFILKANIGVPKELDFTADESWALKSEKPKPISLVQWGYCQVWNSRQESTTKSSFCRNIHWKRGRKTPLFYIAFLDLEKSFDCAWSSYASRRSRSFRSKRLAIESKLFLLYKIMISAVLMCSSETWVLPMKNCELMAALERSLRKIFGS